MSRLTANIDMEMSMINAQLQKQIIVRHVCEMCRSNEVTKCIQKVRITRIFLPIGGCYFVCSLVMVMLKFRMHVKIAHIIANNIWGICIRIKICILCILYTYQRRSDKGSNVSSPE